MPAQPLIVGIGGTTRDSSSSAKALQLALAAAQARGARVALFTGADLVLPMFDPQSTARDTRALAFIQALQRADGLIIASPGYHGSVSGLVKNALDYIEDLRQDTRPYLEGRAVGCIVTAAGAQAIGTTMTALRSVVHALRGWPTPLGVGINSTQVTFQHNGACADPALANQLRILGEQVLEFALRANATGQPVAVGG